VRRAVRLGNGFIGAGSSTTAKFTELVPVARAAMEEYGRPDFQIAKRVYLAVDDDADRAKTRIGEALGALYAGFPLGDLTSVAVYGTPDDVARGLREVLDAGAEMILLNPMFDEHEQLERLAAEVLPQLT